MLYLSITLLVLTSYLAIKLRIIINSKNTNKFMIHESIRVIYNNAEVTEDYSSKGRVFTRGLSLIKRKGDDKYTLISQAKVCDIGLF